MFYHRRQDTFTVTSDDIILTDIRDNTEEELTFLMLILIDGDALKATDLQQAVQVGCGRVSMQFFC